MMVVGAVLPGLGLRGGILFCSSSRDYRGVIWLIL